MSKSNFHPLFFCLVVFLFSCNRHKDFNPNNVEILHANEEQLTQIIIHDIFSPPVASRIYAYTSLAQYEAVRFMNPDSKSFAADLNGFPKIPQPEKGKEYNYILAGTKAFCVVAHQVRIFDSLSLKKYEDSLFGLYIDVLSTDVYRRSMAFGDSIGVKILQRAKTDMYKQTRGMPKYLGSETDGKWQPTAPDYLDGAEPYWSLIKPFSLDSASQFRPMPPLAFSKDTNNAYFRMVAAVYNKQKTLTDSEKNIAHFWDDNSLVMEHSGHLMFADKKITPGGHWMGITNIACHKVNADAVKTAEAYSLVSMSLLDAFISCWDAKYTYEYGRPITVINEYIEKGWDPLLQTPAFPEYTAGHATISGSASTALTYLFGDEFSFHDNSDSLYIGMVRDFTSFKQAAEEASVSRFYGGIHYMPSLDSGLAKGRLVGAHLLSRLKLK